MSDAAAHTFANLLRDFDAVLLSQVGGLRDVETVPIAGSFTDLVAAGGPIELVTRVDAVLHASKPLTVDLRLIERATNAEELLRFVVDMHYRPFQEQLTKAAMAAYLQWETFLNG